MAAMNIREIKTRFENATTDAEKDEMRKALLLLVNRMFNDNLPIAQVAQLLEIEETEAQKLRDAYDTLNSMKTKH